MSVFTKLRFKPGVPVHLLGSETGLAALPGEQGYDVAKILPAGNDAGIQQALLFAENAAALRRDFIALAPRLAPGAILWIAYPKKSGAIASDLTRDAGWKVVDEWGYIGVSQASLNGDWSALWFKKPEAVRSLKRSVPMEDRIAEGVDYKARTVTLPADAADAMSAVPGLSGFFTGLAFTHRREWAEAIADAKKPETRARRIAKMVQDLTKQMREKAAKSAAKN